MKYFRKLLVGFSLMGLINLNLLAQPYQEVYTYVIDFYDFEYDGICYEITSEESKTVSVSEGCSQEYVHVIEDEDDGSISYEWDCEDGSIASIYYSGDIIIPETVKYKDVTYTVTSIGDNAFDCSGLTSIIIPSSVTYIGEGAFSSCSELTSVTIPNSVTVIGRGAFYGCYGLDSVTIPSSVKYIDDYAFCNCCLSSVNIANIESWCNISYGNSDSHPFIQHLYLLNGTEVKDLVIPNGVTRIENGAFYGCLGLTSVTIPNSVTSIGESAFQNCTGLTSVNIPNSVTSIGKYAFADCQSLSSINLPNGITRLPLGVFAGCSQLVSVNIPSSVSSIDGSYYAFIEIWIPKHERGDEGAYKEGVCYGWEFHSSGAFEGCSSLKSINLPNELSTGYETFSYEEEPMAYYFDGIENRMFYGCSSLTSITLPGCVDRIGEDAFYGCDNLTFVKVKKQTPISIDEKTFPTRANIPLYVPMGSGDLYRAANYWKDFKEIIEVENIDDYVLGEIFTAPVDLDNGNKVLMTFKVIDAANKTVQVGVGDSASIVATTEGGLIIPSKVNGYTVTKIGSYAFYYCSNLTSVSIPNTVKTIGDHAFYVCSGLTSLHISANVTSIEDRAFAYCSGLESIEVEAGNKVYDSRNNCNALVKTNTNTLLIGCKNTEIPSSVKVIAEGAFRGCTELTNIEIPEGVTTIGSSAFRGCTGLTSVTLPSTITSIGTYAFSAYDQVYNLTTVTVGMTTPVTITENVFPNRANSTLYVPKGRTDLYKSANYWKEFKVIKEIGDYDFTDVSQMANAIYMDEKPVIPGNRYVFPIKLKNNQLIMGYQFDLELPEGVSFALDDNGKVISTMSERGVGFSIGKQKRSDRVYRFVVISANNNVLTGEDGVVMNVSVDIADDLEAGTYGIVFKNGELTAKVDDAIEAIKLQNVFAAMKVVDVPMGDVNGDGSVSVTDVVSIINYILGNHVANFQEVAADANCDGTIAITDVVRLINIILNDDSYAKPNVMFEE